MLRHHVLVVGDHQVGKSSFCIQLAEKKFTSSYASTLFIEQYHYMINKEHLLVFYDTPGHLRFHTGLEPKYVQCDIAIIVINEDSTLNKWFHRIRRWAPLLSWIVVANTECDEGKEWADKHQIPFCVVNIKTREGMDTVIQQISDLTTFHASRFPQLSLQTTDVPHLHLCG